MLESKEPAPAMEQLVQLAAAADAISAGEPASALVLLEALDPDGNHGVALFLRGVASLRLGEMESARQALERAVALDPDDVASLTVLGRVLYELGDLEGAVVRLQHAVELDEEDAQIRASLGLLYLELARWGEAHDALLAAVEREPDNLEAHRGLAILFTSVGDLEFAELAYRRALELAPTSVSLNIGLGHVLRDLDRPDDAVPVYRRAAELEPDDPVHAANVASALYEAGRLVEARPEYERALALADDAGLGTAIMHLSLGRVLEGLGDVDGAVDEYELALMEDEQVGAAHESLGLIALDLGDEQEARLQFELALETSGLAPASVMQLGLLYGAEQDTAGAQRCVDLLESAGDVDPEVPFRLAQLRVRSPDPAVRDPGAAIVLLEGLVSDRLLQHGAAWNLLAEALADVGRFDRALEAMDEALALSNPADPVWRSYNRRRENYLSQVAEP